MKTRHYLRPLLCLSLCLAASAFAQPQAAGPVAPARLRCNWLDRAALIAPDRVEFSWEVRAAATARGVKQTAYELHVATTPELAASDAPDVWNSGRVDSDQTMAIRYSGPALKPATRYFWTVRTSTGGQPVSAWSEPAHFTTSLGSESWAGKWIGDPTPPPPNRAARNGFHTQFADNADSPKWVTIDLGERRAIEEIRLFPSRPHDFSPDTPGFCFPLRYRIEASDDPAFASPHVLADRTGEDAPMPGKEIVTIPVERREARYVRLYCTKLRQATQGRFAMTLAEMQVLSGGKPVSSGGKVTASDAIEHNDWSLANLTDDDLTSHRADGWTALPAPLMRKEFKLGGEVKHATLFISALGVYEARINGERVGDHELAPEWTDYLTRVQYQAYDVSDLVRNGDNAIGVFLGDGWYAGRLGMAQQFTPDKRPRAVYGRQPRLLAQLHVDFADGTSTRVVTDGSWSTTLAGPIRSSDLLDGEVYDARKEMSGFDKPGFMTIMDLTWTPAVVDTKATPKIDPQMNEPIRVIQDIKPIGFNEPKPGVYVFDLGQNMPGRCRIKVRGEAGATITLRHVEAVNDDGTVYTANLRGAPQIDRYTLAGNPEGETWEPRFTYHGFRFVEWTATGKVDAPTVDSLTGVAFCTDAPVVGEFETTSDMLNKLWSNILWTQYANLMSVPTDCPQRDERLGWMGDILAFAQTASFNQDLAAFYRKWLQDVRDAQANDGRYPDIAPHPYGKDSIFTGVPAWGDAGVFVPWTAYENYADTTLLAEHFASTKRWVDWIYSKNPNHLWKNNRHNDYNDWLNGDTLIFEGWSRKGGEVPRDVFATAFFARSSWIVSQMARVLGHEEDAKKYHDLYTRVREAFNKEFVASDGKMPGDTQAGYALALGFDLLPAELRDEAVAHLVRGIEAYKGHLSTGFHSTHHAMIELTKAGKNDVAYTLVNNTTFPSWGYSIENGATTIWERWDGYVKGRGFQDPGMNSLNHWALGSVGEWMMRSIVGINPDPAHPGWSRAILRPVPGGGLKYARGAHHSCRGVFRSGWWQPPAGDTDVTNYEFTIPPNATAEIWLNAHNAEVMESKKPIAQASGVKVLSPGSATEPMKLEVGSGTYMFSVDPK